MEIVYIQPVVLPGNFDPQPTLYVKYDLHELEGKVFRVNVKNTGCYNGNFVATTLPCKFLAGYRPNLFQSTGLYGIQLKTDWKGFPDYEGIVEIIENSII